MGGTTSWNSWGSEPGGPDGGRRARGVATDPQLHDVLQRVDLGDDRGAREGGRQVVAVGGVKTGFVLPKLGTQPFEVGDRLSLSSPSGPVTPA